MDTITAIIFDLGGVILNIDFDILSDAFKSLGVINFDEMYSQASAFPLFMDIETGKISEQDFYNAIKKFTAPSITSFQIQNAWNALLVDFRKESLKELLRLKSDYLSILLSNTNSIHQRAFNKIYTETIGNGSIDEYFHKSYYSHEIGFRKPDAEVYEFILNENNLTPEKTLLIDDSIQNIDGAKALGMQTIFLEKGMKIEDLGL